MDGIRDNIIMHNRSLSVVIPVMNEARHIPATLQELYDKGLRHLADVEVIILEDGSTDGTAEALRSCETRFPNMTAHTSIDRIGFQTQMQRGIAMSKKEWILLMDGDGQIEPADIHTLLDVPESYDIVTAIKFPRCDPMNRIFVSRCFDLFTDLALGISIRDINFGFKLVRASIARDIAPKCHSLGVLFSAELVIRAVYQGSRVYQVPVRHRNRQIGRSQGIPPSKLASTSIKSLRGIFQLKKELVKEHSK